jgi:hypothetical protein
MRKVLLSIIIFAAMTAFSSCAPEKPMLEAPEEPAATDGARFAAEYMEHNGLLRSNGEPHAVLDISENNPVIYLEADEVISKLESGTGIINLGFPTCPWCREIVPHLIGDGGAGKCAAILYEYTANQRYAGTG